MPPRSQQQRPGLTVVGFLFENGFCRLVTQDGREFEASSPEELWGDLQTIAFDTPPKMLPAGSDDTEPPRARVHRVRAEPISPDEVPGRTIRRNGPTDEQLLGAAEAAGDVFEEACDQEWGALGRAGAQLIRQHAPSVARNFSRGGRFRKRRGGR